MRYLFLSGLIVACLLLGVNGIAWGQCTPASLDSRGAWVNAPIPYGSYNYPLYPPPQNGTYMTLAAFGPVIGCQPETSFPMWWAGYLHFNSGQQSSCNPGMKVAWAYTVYFTSPNPANTDTDCDGIMDNVDPDPLHGTIDSDNDGISDELDPWPNNADCPGSQARYTVFTFRHRTADCTYKYYHDTLGVCDDTYTSTGAGCSGAGAPSASPADWASRLDMATRTWSSLFPENSPDGIDNTPPTDEASGEDAGILQELKRIKADTGVQVTQGETTVTKLEAVKSSVDGVGGKIDATNSKIDSTNSKLDAIKSSIDNKQLSVDVSGIEGRLDTANTKLEAIHTDMPKMGEGSLPDGDASGMQDNSDITGDALGVLEEDAKSSVRSWLDGFWNDNPLIAVINGAGVEYAGAQSSVSVNVAGASISLDFAPAESSLQLIGVFFLAFCGLAGLIDFMRGS